MAHRWAAAWRAKGSPASVAWVAIPCCAGQAAHPQWNFHTRQTQKADRTANGSPALLQAAFGPNEAQSPTPHWADNPPPREAQNYNCTLAKDNRSAKIAWTP
ncbi:hypothetical protein B0T26DRAFT_680849 [Lasiosphaeria miniovina]|uniref:Uncharacterized protein n=1 Tax=Lasiosphaeria miniovina TaxID=1954250 RepID=A0AA39ZT37_9PEZI|nr:uncharacterized protein B0T26DRAFT_680849 [Lasiosphaeria miniovina]KAK0703108.1 hypothetical protein B0T26DRAFT_680849 [Lasiosphaeria miniovina]